MSTTKQFGLPPFQVVQKPSFDSFQAPSPLEPDRPTGSRLTWPSAVNVILNLVFYGVDAVNGWLSARLAASPHDRARLDRVAQAWEKVNTAAREVDEYNLERKPLVFNVFGWLAEAAAH